MGEYKPEEQQARNELHNAERHHWGDGVVSAMKRLKALGVDIAQERKDAAAARKAAAEKEKASRTTPPVDRSAKPSGEKTA